MSDRSLTPPSGIAYEIRRGAGGKLEVKKAGESKAHSVAVDARASVIDAQTQRLHVSHGENRKLFWVYARGAKRVLSWPGGSLELDSSDLTEGAASAGGALKPLKLTMPGKVLSVKVAVGDVVEAGQALVIVEAMKMENLLLATARAKVTKVHVNTGDRLESGAILITFGAVE